MRYTLMLLSVASVLVLVAQSQAFAATGNRDVDAYFQRAGQTAQAQLKSAGVDTSSGFNVKARVDGEGRLTGVFVVGSSGSLENDHKAAVALKGLRVAQPPLELVGAQVNVAIGPQPIVQARNP